MPRASSRLRAQPLIAPPTPAHRRRIATRTLCGSIAGLLSAIAGQAQTCGITDASAPTTPTVGAVLAPAILAGVFLALSVGLIWALVKQRARLRALEDMRHHHEALLAGTQQFACLTDTEGHVLAASASIRQFTAGHVVGNYLWDTPPWSHSTAEQTRLRGAIQQALDGQTPHLETQHTGDDGTIRSLDYTIGAVRGPDTHPRYLLCEGRDITELRRAEARLRAGLDAAPVALCHINRDSVFTLAAGVGLQSLGLEASQITGQRALDVFKTNSAICALLRRALSGETVQGVLPLGTQWIDLRLFPSPDGAILFASVVTELQETRLIRHQLATAVEQTSESVVITDFQGRVQYANPAFEHTSGYALDEIAGQSVNLLKSGQHDDAFYRDLWATILAGRTWRGRFKNRRKNGALFAQEAIITPILDDQHHAQCFVAVGRDVTQEQAAEAGPARAQRTEVIEKLATGVAHDFNNLIQVVLANVSFARDSQATPAELAEYLGQIEQAANRGIHITRQLYTYCRKQTLHLANVDASAMLQDALSRLAARIGPTAAIDLTPASQPAPIRADASMIEQAIGNLCLNARNAMTPGGRIRLSVENKTLAQDDIPAGLTQRPGPYVCISVADTGCGIADDIRPRIFDPFFTTKPAGPGTGLGLASVQGIVQQHGGFIRVESQPGKGSTFHVFLPSLETASAEAPAGAPPSSAAAQPADPAPAATPAAPASLILLADDDESVRQIARTFLKRSGYQVVLAGNGIEATQLAAQQMPQLAVLDAIMPEMGGIEAARLLREQYPTLPIILASGMSAEVNTTDIPGPALAILGKPYASDELLKLVRRMLRPTSPRTP